MRDAVYCQQALGEGRAKLLSTGGDFVKHAAKCNPCYNFYAGALSSQVRQRIDAERERGGRSSPYTPSPQGVGRVSLWEGVDGAVMKGGI